MSKIISRNIRYLKSLATKVSNKEAKATASKVVTLYEKRQMKNITTAENLIKELRNSDEKVRNAAINRVDGKWPGKHVFKIPDNAIHYSAKILLFKPITLLEAAVLPKTVKVIKREGRLWEQTHANEGIHYVHPDLENQTDELLEKVFNKLNTVGVRLASQTPEPIPEEEEAVYRQYVEFLKANETLFDFVTSTLFHMYPRALLLVKYKKLDTQNVPPHNPITAKRKDTQHIGITSKYCLTKLDLSQETFEKAIQNNKYIKNQCWINTLNDVYETNLLSQEKAPRYRITKQKY